MEDLREEHLGWVEVALQVKYSDSPFLKISGQSHFGPSNRIAFIDVFGMSHDRELRRKVRADASDLMRRLGYVVEIEPGRDVYDLTPFRASSAHERMTMLKCLHAALDHDY